MSGVAFGDLPEAERIRRINEAEGLYYTIANGKLSSEEDLLSRLDPSLDAVVNSAHAFYYRIYEATEPNPRIVLISVGYKRLSPELHYAARFLTELIQKRIICCRLGDKLVFEGSTHERDTPTELDAVISGRSSTGEPVPQHYGAALLESLRGTFLGYNIRFTGHDSYELLREQRRAADNAEGIMERWKLGKETWHTHPQAKSQVSLVYDHMTRRSRDYWAEHLERLVPEVGTHRRIYMAVTLLPLVFGELTAALQERDLGYVSLVPKSLQMPAQIQSDAASNI